MKHRLTGHLDRHYAVLSIISLMTTYNEGKKNFSNNMHYCLSVKELPVDNKGLEQTM